MCTIYLDASWDGDAVVVVVDAAQVHSLGVAFAVVVDAVSAQMIDDASGSFVDVDAFLENKYFSYFEHFRKKSYDTNLLHLV